MSSNQKWLVRCEHILETIELLEGEIASMSIEKFMESEKDIAYFERKLEIIGEAVRHLPEHVTARYPHIEWARIVGMRNIISHGYDSVGPDILWDTADNNLSELKAVTQLILAEYGGLS